MIDPDELQQLVQQAFYTEGEPCEGCGRPSSTSLCSECAQADAAAGNCETLSNAITRARSVQQIRKAFQEHRESCPTCRRRNVLEMPSRVDRKEAA